MRYMNLACLLMTLVCLVTILLFSKTNQQQRQQVGALQQQHKLDLEQAASKLAGASTVRRRLEGMGAILHDNEQENPLESLDSLDRQPFISSGSNSRRRSPATNDDGELTTSSGLDESSSFDVNNKQAESSSSSSPSSLNELIQDARQQLKRQQAIERESEESSGSLTTTTTTTTTSVDDLAQKKRHADMVARGLDPLLSQVFEDLDNFGLLKTLGSKLTSGNLTQMSKPIIRKSKNGATIIMSFGGQTNSSSAGAAAATNGTFGQAPMLSSLLNKLIPPMFRSPASLMGDDESSPMSRTKLAPSGFATITINSEPIFRSSSGSALASASPFSQSLFGPPAPVLPLVNPFGFPAQPSGPFIMRPPPALTGPGGLLGMIMRVSKELEEAAAGDGNNKTEIGGAKMSSGEQLNQQASQKVATMHIASPSSLNSTTLIASQQQNSTSTPTNENLDDEVETFDVSQLGASSPRFSASPVSFAQGGAPLPPFLRPFLSSPFSPLRPFYTPNSRSFSSSSSSSPLWPIGRQPSMIMISSSASSPQSIFAPSEPNSMAFEQRHSGDLSSFEMPPHMIMLAGQNNNQAQPLSPMLRAILGNIMPTVARSLEHRNEQEQSTRRDDREQEDGDSESDWDEQFVESRGPFASIRQLQGQKHKLSAGEQQDERPTMFNSIGSESSIFEQMLESSTSGSGPMPIERLSGTIKQIFRGPGMTVERIIELPSTAKATVGQQVQQLKQQLPGDDLGTGEVRAVERGIKSQSISRMDMPDDENSSDHKEQPTLPQISSSSQSHAHFASAHHGPPVSPISGFISRLFNDLPLTNRRSEHPAGGFLSRVAVPASLSASLATKQQQPPTTTIPRHQQDSERSMFDTNEDLEDEASASLEQENNEQINASARNMWLSDKLRDQPTKSISKLHVASVNGWPEVATDQVDPKHIEQLPVFPPRMQRAMRMPSAELTPENQSQPRHQDNVARSPFTSPSSPLFGFPALNTADKISPSNNQGVRVQPETTQKRPFIYHSNHEIATHASESRDKLIEKRYDSPIAVSQKATQINPQPRSSYQHRSSNAQAVTAGLPAAIGMGRRLDEDELIE